MNKGNPSSKGRLPKLQIDHPGRWTLLLCDPWGHSSRAMGCGASEQDLLELTDAAYEDHAGRVLADPDHGKPAAVGQAASPGFVDELLFMVGVHDRPPQTATKRAA